MKYSKRFALVALVVFTIGALLHSVNSSELPKPPDPPDSPKSSDERINDLEKLTDSFRAQFQVLNDKIESLSSLEKRMN